MYLKKTPRAEVIKPTPNIFRCMPVNCFIIDKHERREVSLVKRLHENTTKQCSIQSRVTRKKKREKGRKTENANYWQIRIAVYVYRVPFLDVNLKERKKYVRSLKGHGTKREEETEEL